MADSDKDNCSQRIHQKRLNRREIGDRQNMQCLQHHRQLTFPLRKGNWSIDTCKFYSVNVYLPHLLPSLDRVEFRYHPYWKARPFLQV